MYPTSLHQHFSAVIVRVLPRGQMIVTARKLHTGTGLGLLIFVSSFVVLVLCMCSNYVEMQS